MGTGRLDHLRHRDFLMPDLCILVNEAEEGRVFQLVVETWYVYVGYLRNCLGRIRQIDLEFE